MRGALRLLIRSYPTGLMSRYVAESLQVGGSILVSHPVTTLELPSFLPPSSSFSLPDSAWPPKGKPAVLGCIAGGTGITPVLQLASTVLQEPLARLHLLFSAKTDPDLYLLDHLFAMSQKSGGRLQVWCTVTQSGGATQGGKAQFRTRINSDIIARTMPKPAEVEGAESSGGVGRVLCCGPEGFMREAARLLALEGHRSDRIVLLDA